MGTNLWQSNSQGQQSTYQQTATMSFSNANTGDKPADPYKKQNAEEPDLDTKVKELTDFITTAKFGMMTTHEAATDNLVSRAMALAATETNGIDLLFHTNTESGKTDDLAADSHVNMAFIDSSGQWASIAGQATVVTDRDLVKKHYSPALKAWLGDLGDGKHDGSENDPRIGVIRVEAVTATYAVVRKNAVSRAAEMAQGVITGKAPAVNKLREISEQELSTWRSSNKMVN